MIYRIRVYEKKRVTGETVENLCISCREKDEKNYWQNKIHSGIKNVRNLPNYLIIFLQNVSTLFQQSFQWFRKLIINFAFSPPLWIIFTTG